MAGLRSVKRILPGRFGRLTNQFPARHTSGNILVAFLKGHDYSPQFRSKIK